MRNSRMNWLGHSALALGFSVLLLGGCTQQSRTANSATLMDDLMAENEELRSELASRNQALDEVSMELRSNGESVAAMRRQLEEAERAAANAQSAPAPMTITASNAPATGFEGIENVTGTYNAGEVTATIESDILFDSGKATLKTNAKKALDQVAAVLRNDYGSRRVRIGGYTDTDPIKKSNFKSNHHLGFERAWAVRDYLVKKGVEDGQVYIASYGPDRPLATKSKSRRVDIAVIMN